MKTITPPAARTKTLLLTKGEHKFLFRYPAGGYPELFRALGRTASNPELSFDWRDAAAISMMLRKGK